MALPKKFYLEEGFCINTESLRNISVIVLSISTRNRRGGLGVKSSRHYLKNVFVVGSEKETEPCPQCCSLLASELTRTFLCDEAPIESHHVVRMFLLCTNTLRSPCNEIQTVIQLR